MALSKVKSKKQAKRLAARIKEFNDIRAEDQKAFTKPGSNRK